MNYWSLEHAFQICCPETFPAGRDITKHKGMPVTTGQTTG